MLPVAISEQRQNSDTLTMTLSGRYGLNNKTELYSHLTATSNSSRIYANKESSSVNSQQLSQLVVGTNHQFSEDNDSPALLAFVEVALAENTAIDGTESFADLQQAVKKFGFKAIGLSTHFAKLKTIKIPALVYLRYRDNDHFSVIRGINNQGVVWLGDPSWGNRLFSEHQFRAMWETRTDQNLKGKLLLFIPIDKTMTSINKDFYRPPAVNNTAVELFTARPFRVDNQFKP
jgi:hypothetical protein